MKKCKRCGTKIPCSIMIDGVRRILQNRVHCIVCVPYGKSRYVTKTEEGRRKRIAQKARSYYHRYKRNNGVDKISERRKKYKQYIIKLLGGECQICGYNRCIRNFTFHHIRDKRFEISERAFQFSLSKTLPELKKCILICHNCHGEIHDGLVKLEIIDKLNCRNIEMLQKLERKSWSDVIGWDAQ
jgi:hypothetical protein